VHRGTRDVNTREVTTRALLVCRAQNPALRHELSFEMSQMHSDAVLYFGADENDAAAGGPEEPKPVLSRANVIGSKAPRLSTAAVFDTP
jgi:hypothetical protein